MKIVGARLHLTRIPTSRSHKMAIGTTRYQESVFLEVRTDEGVSGWGEAPHMVGHSHAGETQDTVALQLRDRLVPAVLGKDPFAIEEVRAVMDRTLPRNPRAKSAVEMALYDLAGTALGVPVYQLLGGLVRPGIPLSWSLGIMPLAELCAEAEKMVARGFTILKVKVGARDNVDDDIAAFEAVRETVGPDVRIRADANQGYQVGEAVRATLAMEEYGIEFMEQPVHADDLAGMAEVRTRVTTEIMADESANSPEEVHRVAEARAASLISVYINTGGGISAAKRMTHVAEAAGLRCYVGGALEGPVAARACLHFGCSSPSVTMGGEQAAQFLLTAELGREPIEFTGGQLMVPHTPGLGAAVDPEVLAAHEIGTFTVS
ncbi:mandelate racemase/muconate lactonizing enzyme family protein [Amycolatopsis jejuensis]|uniref:mandelate racemase/muconate lactonizing enzyme family protein n=1 Tax=Amycolatopsis jejuensis TaxID=330084 RepID=UPI0005254004|nr:enolase C-terminal domain-like protein [Amycolatopsis jejuensis]